MTRKIRFLFFLGGIVLFLLIPNFDSSSAEAANNNAAQCINDCLDTRDICLKSSAVPEVECANECNKQAGYPQNYSFCLQNASDIFKNCKSLIVEETKDPWFVRIFLGKGHTLEGCLAEFQKNQQSCRDKQAKYDSCLKKCKDEQQARHDKCMNDFNNCIGKCPPANECETDEDCDKRSGNSCAISTCGKVDFGRASGIKGKICSYSYKSHGTCCPDGKTGPRTCQMVGPFETTCTGGPCGDRDSDGISDKEDNCPDSPGVYTGECPKKSTKQTTPTFPKKIFEKIKNIVFFEKIKNIILCFSLSCQPKTSSPPPKAPASTPLTSTGGSSGSTTTSRPTSGSSGSTTTVRPTAGSTSGSTGGSSGSTTTSRPTAGSTAPTSPAPQCGNNIIEAGETCEKDKDCAQGFKCCPESCNCFPR